MVFRGSPQEVEGLVGELLNILLKALMKFKATWGYCYLVMLAIVYANVDLKKRFEILISAIERHAPMTVSHSFILLICYVLPNANVEHLSCARNFRLY